MRYLSVCSGIEAASAAWHPLGWEPAAFSEIDAFPRAVLAHHYPSVPLHGDFTTIRADDYGPVDLLVGGTPCQSFSVAGLRKGLGDDRGNLALEFMRLAARISPTWITWENVPGVLPSNGGRDFGSILGALEELGYGWAYRVLDAQYFGVPQRRRRVFVVGCLGSWQRAAAVLFERHGLQGNPAPRREAGENVTGTLKACARSGGWSNSTDHASAGYMIPADTAPTVPARRSGGGGLGTDFDCDGGLIPHAVAVDRFNGNVHEESAYSATTSTRHYKGLAMTFDLAQITSAANRTRVGPELPASTLNAKGQMHVSAFNWQSGGDARGLDPKPTAQLQRCQTPAVTTGAAVRRLTPRECERLQGFPDDFTLIPWRNKPADQCPDGPRYKALGNSMAVPVMRWMGERIQMVEGLSP